MILSQISSRKALNGYFHYVNPVKTNLYEKKGSDYRQSNINFYR